MPSSTHWPLEDVALILKVQFSYSLHRLVTNSLRNLWWMPQKLINEKSTLPHIMDWGHQTKSHYLSQYWHRSMSMSSYGVIGHNVSKRFFRICELNIIKSDQNGHHFADNIFKHIVLNKTFLISKKVPLRFASKGLICNKSAEVWVMAWCCQATSHYLNQCPPRSMMLYKTTSQSRPLSIVLIIRNIIPHHMFFVFVFHIWWYEMKVYNI